MCMQTLLRGSSIVYRGLCGLGTHQRIVPSEDRRYDCGRCWSVRGKWDGLGPLTLEKESNGDEHEHGKETAIEQSEVGGQRNNRDGMQMPAL